MAKNIIMEPGWSLPVVVTHPATPESGDPVRYGVFTGVALTDEGDGGNAATETSVYFGPCVVEMAAAGVNNDGNSAIQAGDAIYYVDGDTPNLSKKAAGYFFGFALSGVGSGQTGTIRILKPASPGLNITVEDQNTRAVAMDVPAASAGDSSAILKSLFVASEDIEITAVHFIPATAQAGANTNTATLALRNIGSDGTGDSNIVTFPQTSGNDLAAHVPADFGGALDNEDVNTGDVLAWHRTKVGDGVASPAGTVIIEYLVVAA